MPLAVFAASAGALTVAAAFVPLVIFAAPCPRPPSCPLALFAASPPSAPPLHGVLMGKVYFYALDLARISASQALLMGKVPTTKLDLARSVPTKWNSGSLPENASRRGGRGKVGHGKGGLPRHRRRSVAGAAAIIRPAAGSNIPEGLSSPACYCPLRGAWSRNVRVYRSALDSTPPPGHPCATKAQRWP